MKYIFLHTDHENSGLKVDLKNINVVLKLLMLFSKLFIKERLVFVFRNVTFDDTQILFLVKRSLWSKVAFMDCIIRTTKRDIRCEYFSQKSEFINWEFKGISQYYEFKEFALKIQNRKLGMLSLSKFAYNDHNKMKFAEDHLCFVKKKRSMIYRYYTWFK